MHLNHLHLFGKPKRQQTLPLTRGASMHNAVQLYLSYIYLQFAVLASHSYIVESFYVNVCLVSLPACLPNA